MVKQHNTLYTICTTHLADALIQTDGAGTVLPQQKRKEKDENNTWAGFEIESVFLKDFCLFKCNIFQAEGTKCYCMLDSNYLCDLSSCMKEQNGNQFSGSLKVQHVAF